jgi:hypothetical protein
MGPVSASTMIDAPRERVFDFLCDLANRPAITSHFVDEFRLERLQSAGPGAAARFRIPDRGLWMETVIEEAAHPHRIYERGAGGRWDRISIFTVWEQVEGPAANTCEATVTFWTEPSHPVDRIRDLAPWVEPWYRRQWSKALARLRAAVEGELPAERLMVAGGDLVPGAG